MIIQRKRNDSETSVGLYIVELTDRVIGLEPIPLSDRFIKFVKLGGLENDGCLLPGSSRGHIEVEMICQRVKSIDNDMDEGPQVARVVETGIEKLAGIGSQVNNTDLCEEKVENIEVPSFA